MLGLSRIPDTLGRKCHARSSADTQVLGSGPNLTGKAFTDKKPNSKSKPCKNQLRFHFFQCWGRDECFSARSPFPKPVYGLRAFPAPAGKLRVFHFAVSRLLGMQRNPSPPVHGGRWAFQCLYHLSNAPRGNVGDFFELRLWVLFDSLQTRPRSTRLLVSSRAT